MMETCEHRAAHDMNGLCASCEDAVHSAQHPNVVEGCFACKVSRITLKFTYGKEDFHGPTINERIEEQERICREDGVDAEPVGSRWV